jgi:signal transduction histidine kinase
MVPFTKIRWIPILMILSQVMLTGFVAYWLKSQFNDERAVLRVDLSRIYDDSRNQVIDSLLFNRVVEPVLKDSVTITMMAAEQGDSGAHLVARPMQTGAFYAKNDTCERTMVAIALRDSMADERIGTTATFVQSNSKQDMLIRSVRLFINHSSDTSASRVGFPLVLPGNPDTALFRRVFNEKVALKKYGIEVGWSSDTAKHAKKVKMVELSGMQFSSAFPDNLPGVRVKGEFPYLIRRMSPQILFAMILLLLTGSAFFFTHRSLKRQMILNSLRNDFVSNITHELRTPVATVKVALEALKTFDKVSNPVITRDYLDMAGQEMNRLEQLIGKVLDQSLIGEQKQVIQPQLSNVNHLIEIVLLSLQPRLDARNAKIRFDSPVLPGAVMVDPLHFQGVLINLIDNSLKYGPEYPEIEIRLWQDNGSACIEVSDNGPGIPKEYLGRIFDKFFRVPTGDTHNIKGYGLGLSFAALVMKQHQGSISVKNLDRGGCAFTLRLPPEAI